jgi:bifunctional enzyme CysN/CysC
MLTPGLQTDDHGKDILRFLTCGSVDDGKSTLIGRLLHDSKLIFDDQLLALTRDSERHGTTGDELDFALLVDGLEAEWQQGITIDVAHRFFTTEKRSFIASDTPGHEQYTRNMATGASNADLAIILIDARKGVMVQTRRHSLICSLLGLRHVVLAVNKIDLISYQEEVFDRVVADYNSFASRFKFASIAAIPISARYGDNIIGLSAKTAWYRGPALLDYLETVQIDASATEHPFRFPVQWVNRPDPDFRGYAGTVVSGRVAVGDPVTVAVSGRLSRVKELLTYDGGQESAQAGDAITVTLTDNVDIARGDILASPAGLPEVSDQLAVTIVWMDEQALLPGRSYLARIGNKVTPVTITTIKHRIDVNTLEHLPAGSLALNDIALCHLATDMTVAFDRYEQNRRTGSLIIIDRFTNHTVGAGMIELALPRRADIQRQPTLVEKIQRAAQKHQVPAIVWFTGLPASGKSTIANITERKLHATGYHTMLLDGDNLRHGLNRDLGFSDEERVENIRRAGEVAKLLTDAGLIALCSFISPYRAEREMIRSLVQDGHFVEVFVDTPLEECIRRDPKGLYSKARAGKIKNFTGLDAHYEVPENPEIHLRSAIQSPEEQADCVMAKLASLGIIR